MAKAKSSKSKQPTAQTPLRPKQKYDVRLTELAAKDLDDLGSLRERAIEELQQLKTDPLAGHTLNQNLKGMRSLVWAMPGGEYRVIYKILSDKLVCLVVLVGPHENIYDKATRRVAALRRAGVL